MESVIAKQNSLRLRLHDYLTSSLLVASDFIAICIAVYLALFLREFLVNLLAGQSEAILIPEAYLYLVLPTFYVSAIACTGLYQRRLLFHQWAQSFFKLTSCLCAAGIVALYLIGKAETVSRLFVALFWLSSFLTLCSGRYAARKLLLLLGIWQRPVIIIGAGKTAELLADSFERDRGIGYEIIGFIEDDRNRPLLKKYPYLGNFQEAEQAVLCASVQDVILATPGLKRKELVKLFYRIQPHVRNLTIVPDVFGVPVGNVEVEGFYDQKTILLKMQNNMKKQRNRWLKRSFDFTASLVGSLAIAPLLLCISAAIYIASPGPVIFAHRRVGSRGRKFPCYKFRTMVTNAQEQLEKHLRENLAARAEWEKDFKLKDDPRVTKIGAFLRKTSLDELPQLFNVIKGEMSLVGPRPIVEKEIERYGSYIEDYYLVRPGMTGYWQVSGRNDIDYEERVQMDAWYVRNWSLWQDIVLLLKTVKVVVGRNGAY